MSGRLSRTAEEGEISEPGSFAPRERSSGVELLVGVARKRNALLREQVLGERGAVEP